MELVQKVILDAYSLKTENILKDSPLYGMWYSQETSNVK